jgi:hypothetical protein
VEILLIGGDQNSFAVRTHFLVLSRCLVSPGAEIITLDIYVYMQGQRRGPYEKPQLEEMWKAGRIPADTLYWHEGMSKWDVISDLFANDVIANIPPVLAHADSAESELAGDLKTPGSDNPISL